MPAVPLMMSLDSTASVPEPCGHAMPVPAVRARSTRSWAASPGVGPVHVETGRAPGLGQNEGDAGQAGVEAGAGDVGEGGGEVRRAFRGSVDVALVAGRVVEFEREGQDAGAVRVQRVAGGFGVGGVGGPRRAPSRADARRVEPVPGLDGDLEVGAVEAGAGGRPAVGGQRAERGGGQRERRGGAGRAGEERAPREVVVAGFAHVSCLPPRAACPARRPTTTSARSRGCPGTARRASRRRRGGRSSSPSRCGWCCGCRPAGWRRG